MKKPLSFSALLVCFSLFAMDQSGYSSFDQHDMEQLQLFLNAPTCYYRYLQANKHRREYAEYNELVGKYHEKLKAGIRMQLEDIELSHIPKILDLIEHKCIDDYMWGVEGAVTLIRGIPYIVASTLCVLGLYYCG